MGIFAVPQLPGTQVNTDWDSTGGASELLNKPTNIGRWVQAGTIKYTDYNTVHGTAFSVDLAYSLPKNCIIHGTWIDLKTTFSGTGITGASVVIGSAASPNRYMNSASLFTGVTLVQPQNRTGIESTSLDLVLKALLTITGAGVFLEALTQGEADIWVFVSKVAAV